MKAECFVRSISQANFELPRHSTFCHSSQAPKFPRAWNKTPFWKCWRMLFVSSLVLIKRDAASGTNNYFLESKKKKKRHEMAKDRAGTTYPHGLCTPKLFGTGAHHLPIQLNVKNRGCRTLKFGHPCQINTGTVPKTLVV